MSHENVNAHATSAISEVCTSFTRNIGSKHEELLWGIKATRQIIDCTIDIVQSMSNHKKVSAVKVLPDAISDIAILEVITKGLQRNTVVYIPHADEWDQNILLKAMALIGARKSKCMLGFTEPSKLCFGVYMFLVIYQVDTESKVSRWALNMSAPIQDFASLH